MGTLLAPTTDSDVMALPMVILPRTSDGPRGRHGKVWSCDVEEDVRSEEEYEIHQEAHETSCSCQVERCMDNVALNGGDTRPVGGDGMTPWLGSTLVSDTHVMTPADMYIICETCVIGYDTGRRVVVSLEQRAPQPALALVALVLRLRPLLPLSFARYNVGGTVDLIVSPAGLALVHWEAGGPPPLTGDGTLDGSATVAREGKQYAAPVVCSWGLPCMTIGMLTVSAYAPSMPLHIGMCPSISPFARNVPLHISPMLTSAHRFVCLAPTSAPLQLRMVVSKLKGIEFVFAGPYMSIKLGGSQPVLADDEQSIVYMPRNAGGYFAVHANWFDDVPAAFSCTLVTFEELPVALRILVQLYEEGRCVPVNVGRESFPLWVNTLSIRSGDGNIIFRSSRWTAEQNVTLRVDDATCAFMLIDEDHHLLDISPTMEEVDVSWLFIPAETMPRMHVRPDDRTIARMWDSLMNSKALISSGTSVMCGMLGSFFVCRELGGISRRYGRLESAPGNMWLFGTTGGSSDGVVAIQPNKPKLRWYRTGGVQGDLITEAAIPPGLLSLIVQTMVCSKVLGTVVADMVAVVYVGDLHMVRKMPRPFRRSSQRGTPHRVLMDAVSRICDREATTISSHYVLSAILGHIFFLSRHVDTKLAARGDQQQLAQNRLVRSMAAWRSAAARDSRKVHTIVPWWQCEPPIACGRWVVYVSEEGLIIRESDGNRWSLICQAVSMFGGFVVVSHGHGARAGHSGAGGGGGGGGGGAAAADRSAVTRGHGYDDSDIDHESEDGNDDSDHDDEDESSDGYDDDCDDGDDGDDDDEPEGEGDGDSDGYDDDDQHASTSAERDSHDMEAGAFSCSFWDGHIKVRAINNVRESLFDTKTYWVA